MKYIDEFRDPRLARGLVEQIRTRVHRPLRLMEFCGGHTHAILRFGIRALLPPDVEMLSGPGCPVCVTSSAELDEAIALAQVPGVILASFGDMIRVPGSRGTLQSARAGGADVRIVYSPTDAVKLAEKNSSRPVIFLGVGFETTAPGVAASILQAHQQGIKNYFVLCLHKLTPPATKAILDAGEVNLSGILGPGHVTTVIGTDAWTFLSDQYRVPMAVAGFEPLDILRAIGMLVDQVNEGRARVYNAYSRSVLPGGNRTALAVMNEVFETSDAEWRGLGPLPQSGMSLRKKYAAFDASKVSMSPWRPPRTLPAVIVEKCCGGSPHLKSVLCSAAPALLKLPSARAWSLLKAHARPIIILGISNLNNYKIELAHGAGGRMTHELIDGLFKRFFSNVYLDLLSDAAVVPNPHGKLALTTDSYVIQPIFFIGGDIGKLAVCGTINDLSMVGAKPLYLTTGFILEEGLPYADLEQIVSSMARTAAEAGVKIVAGDTKVVEHGSADRIFINTAGMGWIPDNVDLSPKNVRPGDRIIVSGSIGDHGMAVLSQREGLEFSTSIVSDCAPLNDLVRVVFDRHREIRVMRDPTRGGLATSLVELAQSSGLGFEMEETCVPVREGVRAACELLGLNALYVANEGKLIAIASPEEAESILSTLQDHPLGREARIIGRVVEDHPRKVVLKTILGVRRVLEILAAEQLPRIC